MIIQADLDAEATRSKRRRKLELALEYELDNAIQSRRGVLTGFSVKITPGYTLLTLRAIINDIPSVCFVGADSAMNCIIKASTKAKRDKLRWQPDSYKTDQV